MIRSPHTDSDFFRPRNPPPPVAPQNVESCCIWDSVQSVEQPCRDPLPLVPRQPEVLVLELVRETDVARVLEAGAEVEVFDPRPVDGAHAHRTGRSIDIDVATLKHLCALRNQ